MYKYNLRSVRPLLCSTICLMILAVSTPASAEVKPQTIILIFQRLEILEEKSRQLTGENEVLKHQLEQLKKVQKKGFLNVDDQIDKMREDIKEDLTPQATSTIEPTDTAEPSATQVPTATVEPVTAGTVVNEEIAANTTFETASLAAQTGGVKTIPATPEEIAAADSTKKIRAPSAYEKEIYQTAFNKMSASPAAATQAFREYIKLQPSSPLAANAQYWIGEIMYSHNNYKGAIQEFIKVLQQYKTSSKAPDAAIKLGYSFYALKNWTYARRTFEDVLRYFPSNKNAVDLAIKRLAEMKAAGN